MADDHPLFLDGLHAMLTARGFEVVGMALDGVEAVAKTRRLHPEIVLMDIAMPHCDGLEATSKIKEELPEVKVIIVTGAFQDDELFTALKCGASGYLLKSQFGEDFFERLEGLVVGEAPLAQGLSTRVLAEFSRLGRAGEMAPPQSSGPETELTEKQKSILGLVAQGLTYKEVAAKLNFAERTVKYHMRSILEQLHLESRAEAIAYAGRIGLVWENGPWAATKEKRTP